MKRTMLVVLFLAGVSLIYSQERAREFLGRMPSMPQDPCSFNQEFKDRYVQSIEEYIAEIEEVLAPLREQTESNYQVDANEMMKKYMKQFNLSEADVQKLKNNKGDKKTQDKVKADMASKIVQEKYNMNMDVSQYQKLSEEGKKAYAQGMGAEKMAEMQADPQVNKDGEAKDAKLVELMTERDRILNKIRASDQSAANKFQEFYEYQRKAYDEMDVQRAPLLKKIGDNDPNVDASGLIAQVKQLEDSYCYQVTPKFVEIVKEKINDITIMLDDYEKLGELYAKINEISMDTNKNLESPDVMSLGAVEGIAGMMKDVCQFSNHTFGD